MSEQVEISPARHEPKDVGGILIWAGPALVVATVLVMALLVLWLFPNSLADRALHPPLALYPDPQLQPSPRADMANFYSQEMQMLNGAGWVDKAHGIVHIPIADAMRKVVQEGIPGWPAAPENQP